MIASLLFLSLVTFGQDIKPIEVPPPKPVKPNPVDPSKTVAKPIGAKELPVTIRVVVFNFDPIIQSEGKPLSVYAGWNNPRQLAQQYIDAVKQASGGYINYNVTYWKDVNGFPVKKDGFRYTVDSYLSALRGDSKWHEADEMDYPRVLREQGILPRIDSGEFHEVWFFGAPYMGFWESAMAGPGAFYINGGVYPEVETQKPFAIMGFNYERGVAEMLHNLCHRTEATMTRIFGGWEADKLEHDWARFAANAQQSNGFAAVGSCHYPPNAEKDYDYANKRYVESTADDWLNYPNLTGKKTRINCEAWGGPDYHLNYMKWWFTRLPKASGTNKDGRQNNWWKYVFEFQDYNEKGLLISKPRTGIIR